MIYVCIASHNNADTIGLLLWKIRKVFDDFPREYHFLVGDDASTDSSAEVLASYEDVLPLSVIRHDRSEGYASTLEQLLRDALDRTDRPRRDCVVTLPADFSVSPDALPDLIKRIESGMDVVVGETPVHEVRPSMRLVRRSAPWLLKPGLSLGGFRDLFSGVYAFRLVTLRNCLRDDSGPFLQSDGALANAELIARAVVGARQIAATPVPARLRAKPEGRAFSLALQLLRGGRQLRIPDAGITVQRGAGA